MTWIVSLLLAAQAFAAQATNPAIPFFKQLYPLSDPYQKLVDNKGNGYEDLYGVRNFRVVLYGVMYRGGANNAYNKHGQRPNSNPLPNEGLINLCEEGFSKSFYMYTTNYATAPHEVLCKSRLSKNTRLNYLQKSPIGSPANVKEILKAVYTTIYSQTDGPVYIHCWNGWHASGLASALALRQFCGMSKEAAVEYWNRNIDGNDSSSYDRIRQQIRDFQPYAELQIPADVQAQICPTL